MLEDDVEATAKTIADPNPSRFRDMVHSLVLKRRLDHQLNECDLTMRDLTRIEDSFVRTLTFMYHGRIRYPEKEPGQGSGYDHRGSRRFAPPPAAPVNSPPPVSQGPPSPPPTGTQAFVRPAES